MNATDADRPRVMLIIAQLSLGGAERQLVLLVRELATQYRFFVVAYDDLDRTAYADELKSLGAEVAIIERKPGWMGKLMFLRDLLNVIRQQRPDVIHTWLVSANFWGLLAARLLGLQARTIASIRNIRELDSFLFERVLNRTLFRWASSIISNTQAAKTILCGYGVPESLVHVIPNGIDPSRYQVSESRDAVRQSMGLPIDGLIIGTIGRLEEQKNHALLLDAAAELARKHPRVHVVVVGEGRLRPVLESKINDLGLAGKVTLLGSRRDIPRVFRTLDLFVLSSDWEGYPNVVMESMCAGVPVVATDVGGVSELVTHQVSGWLVAPGNILALVNAIDRMLSDPALASAYAQAAREHIESQCTLRRMAENTSARYQRVLSDC